LDFCISVWTLNEAMRNAQGAAQENEIREQMRENERRAAQQRQMAMPQRTVYQVAGAPPTQGGVYALPYRNSGIVGPRPGVRQRPPAKVMDGSKRFWGAIITIIIIGIRGLNLGASSGYNSTTTSRPPPQNYYQPSYSPPPPQRQPSWSPSHSQSPSRGSPQPYRSGRR
jgi:hypothetical protein